MHIRFVRTLALICGALLVLTAEAAADPISQISEFRHGSADINHAAFSPEGRFLVSGRPDGFIRVWDLREIYTQP
jgi:WD40 repeat protein